MEGKIEHSASRIAAGLINPFIGPKLNLPFAFQQCIDGSLDFFGKWNTQFDDFLFKTESLLRIFKSEKQKAKWDDLRRNTVSSRYTLSSISSEELRDSGIMGKYGAGETKAFRLDIEKFLQLSRQKLKSMNCWVEETFDYKEVNKNEIIIFAEGYNVCENPYFNWLPFAPAQGEILEFTGPQSPALSNGTWFLPNKLNFIAGSTWRHKDLKSGPTKTGYDTICENLKFIPISKYKKFNHLSGIRSGTLDRNPIIGQHPKLGNLYIFNGFGSRGSTTIKLHADHLTELIINGVKLPQYIDLNRFITLFPKI